MWWHVLSLDAPTIGFLWALFFMRALHIPCQVPELLALTATVWIIYVGDRLLDGLHAPIRTDRHQFYARHRYGSASLLLLVACVTGWMGISWLNRETILAGIALSAVVIVYFLLVHMENNAISQWFPKELVAGAVFATGIAIPAWTHGAETRKALIPGTLLYAALCALNCIAIECWENHRGESRGEKQSHWLIQEANPRIAQIAAFLIGCAGVYCLFDAHLAGVKELLGASAISLAFIAALDRRSSQLSPQVLRVLADAALLTPALFLLKSVL